VNLRIVEKLQLGRLATPLPDRRRPIYNWFHIKEAFSRDLVRLLTETWGLHEGDLVLDPFCGVGTTPLACKELDLDCVGFDVHPMILLASRVKLRDYVPEELKKAIEKLMELKFEKTEVEVPSFMARVFPKSILDDIFFFRRRISEVADEGIRELMMLGLAIAAMKCSWAQKDGAAIRVVKRSVPPLQKALERQFLLMYRDLERFTTKPARVRVEQCDARELKLEDESIDAVITSPPYLRKQEYIQIYRIEQWILGLEGPRADELIGIRTGNAGEEDFSEVEDYIEGKPLDAKLYFKDMFAALQELYRVCKHGARVCLVTSDGCFPEGVVEVCETLSRLAERAGFRAKRMIVVNKRFCTTPARKKVGVARECLLMWER
jgi:DNA modification methylase